MATNWLQIAFVAEWLRRYVQVVVNIVGVGSSPTECIFFFFLELLAPNTRGKIEQNIEGVGGAK